MLLYLDIETVPAQRPDVLEEIRAAEQATLDAALSAIKPPGNYKKQETIDEWMATEAPKIRESLTAAFDANVDAAYRKTGLDGAFGQICVIGFALNDLAPIALWDSAWGDSDTERALLEAFYCTLTDIIPANMERATCVVGHNVTGFDLRYMVQRSIVNNVRPHRVIIGAAQAKPWELQTVFDTMIQWGGTGAKPGGSLDKLCRALSIPSPKGDITGATVWDAVKAGRIAEVAEYCKRDVEATRSIHHRMTFRAPVKVEQLEDVPA